jgi:hypothetical protein
MENFIFLTCTAKIGYQQIPTESFNGNLDFPKMGIAGYVSVCVQHVVKDSDNQHTIKLHADGNITCNTH